MRARALLLVGLLAAMAACTQAPPPAPVDENPLLVPSTALVAPKGPRPAAAPTRLVPYPAILNPYQVLPATDGEIFIARGERSAYGAYQLSEFSAYTIYTYDSQPIYVPTTGGSGYRNRWIVQQGISFPTP